MTQALEKAWADVQKRHSTVPDVVLAVAPGKSGSRCGAVAWADSPVLLVDTSTLEGSADELLGWLLHQAAHGLAGQPSQASEGRYHNSKFQLAARTLGLATEDEPRPGTGWSSTAMTPELRAGYAKTIERLGKAQAEEGAPPPPARAAQAQRPASRMRVAVRCSCDPPRRIQVTGSQLAKAPIRCDACGDEFVEVS